MGAAPGTGAAAHACGDEHHVRAVDDLGDAVAVLFRRGLADLGLGACPQPLGQVRADLQLHARLAAAERLRIGVDDDELHALHPLVDHVIDGVAAATTDTHHLDHRALRLCVH